MSLKNRGQSKKTEGRTRQKSKGGSLAVGTYLQKGSAPPPPGGRSIERRDDLNDPRWIILSPDGILGQSLPRLYMYIYMGLVSLW